MKTRTKSRASKAFFSLYKTEEKLKTRKSGIVNRKNRRNGRLNNGKVSQIKRRNKGEISETPITEEWLSSVRW